ncbi:NAD(P)/FAD-dependent oxidoreductase [Fodinisporobacter ferrooxydans]|uniref:NAD(P)/FAD-dependent oxidoreductase n=1 Tax=Fodinisporobacter ferrooxydans TaxID=2901836 RepID=A0ABY4CIZ8_9BACL|nr:NAD(P)/FAD-dependent oxidoreductase [Alicyclobacillaceae bacterium MYW30-H2]
MPKRVVILGAGYAGLVTALELRKNATPEDTEVILVNKHNYHQLVTQLHELGAGAKSDTSARIMIEPVIRNKYITLIKDHVESIDPKEKRVRLSQQELSYDYLVVALGSETEYFGIPGLKEHSFILKSINQARLLRTHIERCFAEYHYTRDESLLTFVVGGAGFSGIELVGEFADRMPVLCEENNIPLDKVKLFNVEAAPSILPGFDKELVERAEKSLTERGVKFLVGVPIVQVEPGKVHLKNGDVIATQTLVWTGGVRGNQIVIDAGFETEPRGRAKVNEYLQALGYEDVYIIGDSCFIINEETGRPYPPTAQIAGQMGTAVGKYLFADLRGGTKEPFKPQIMGSIASLGRKDAIAKIGKNYQATGRFAYIVKDMSKLRYLAKIGAVIKKA